MVVGYDVTRLFLGPLSATPRGIDRVELEYAKFFFEGSREDCVGILPTVWGTRIFPRERIVKGIDHLERLWAERGADKSDPAWPWLMDRLSGRKTERPFFEPARRGVVAGSLNLFSSLRATGFEFGKSARHALPDASAYLNIGHISLALPFLLRWLEHRADVKPVFMLHDVIPLQTPEYVVPTSVTGHDRMLRQTARHAAGLIVTTNAVEISVREALGRYGRTDLPTWASPFPVPVSFSEPPPPDAFLRSVPYFLICGAIEPRKNHLLLVEIWKRLMDELGEQAPHLIVAGAPGWQGSAIRERLVRSLPSRDKIHVVTGLSTPALKTLMAHARALLMPSFIEGFGLPIVEAARLGTPVIASDIAAHREVAPLHATLIDPIDGPAWKHAILTARASSPIEDQNSSQNGRAFGWPDYFSSLSSFLKDLRPRKNAI